MRSREHPRDNAGGFSFVSLLLNVIAREVVVIYARVRPVRRCPKFARTPSIPALRPIDARRPAMTTTTERVVVVDIRPSVRSFVRPRARSRHTYQSFRALNARAQKRIHESVLFQPRPVRRRRLLPERSRRRALESFDFLARASRELGLRRRHATRRDGWMDGFGVKN